MGAGDEEIAPIRLETDRLILRDVVADDVDGFLAYMADPAYIRHLPLDPITRADVETWVGVALVGQRPGPRERYLLAAVERASGRLIGEAIFKRPNGIEGEIGWGLAASEQGQGLATEIGQALVEFGFGTLGLHRLIARCELGNIASERVMAKLGMAQEGVFREHIHARGRWWSSVQWAVLNPLPLAGEGRGTARPSPSPALTGRVPSLSRKR